MQLSTTEGAAEKLTRKRKIRKLYAYYKCNHHKKLKGKIMTIEDNAKVLREMLMKDGWKFDEREEESETVFLTGVVSESGVYGGYDIVVSVRENDFQSIFIPPVTVPEKLRPAVMEFITRVNYAIRYGKLVMDVDDGELRYEMVIGADIPEKSFKESFGNLFQLPGFVLDKYMPGLAAVLLGLKTPKEAFEGCHDEGVASSGADGDGEKISKSKSRKKLKKEKGIKKAGKKDDSSGDRKTAAKYNYSLSGLNIHGKVALNKIVDAVMRFRDGTEKPDVDKPRLNILLSGAPGSGKTAFAMYLANAAGAPIRTVKASEILSQYVGGAEKKLALIFKGAEEKNEILFLDEIDSFLLDRSMSRHSWEVTQVNELLQQMENFGGVMIGATNFHDCLDKAVLRRFTFKLKFDYLSDEGKRIFFERYFKTPLTEDESMRLSSIGKLTPGDFRTVREKLFYLSDFQTNGERLDALEAESEAKGKEMPRIGFGM